MQRVCGSSATRTPDLPCMKRTCTAGMIVNTLWIHCCVFDLNSAHVLQESPDETLRVLPISGALLRGTSMWAMPRMKLVNDLVAETSGGLVQHSLFYWIFQQHITLQIERTVVWLYEKPKRAWTNHVVSDSSSDTVVKRVKSFRCHTKTVLSTLFPPRL